MISNEGKMEKSFLNFKVTPLMNISPSIERDLVPICRRPIQTGTHPILLAPST